MSITYEEALGTLEAMFGEPWTRETLDAVLRHEKGHMENTCERILNHGSQDPQILVDNLKNAPPAPEALMPPVPTKKGRGTPTDLPEDFLRIPGYRHRSTAVSSGGAAMDDETLARMLQDELFSEELARNPDFAHLARGSRSGRSGRGNARGVPGNRRPTAGSNVPPPNPFEGVNVMENLSSTYELLNGRFMLFHVPHRLVSSCSEMGESARRRLQMFAVNFENRLGGKGPASPAAATLQEDSGAVAERRGLLDDDFEEEIEFEMREKKSN